MVEDKKRKPFEETVPLTSAIDKAYRHLKVADRHAAATPASIPEGQLMASRINSQGQEVEPSGHIKPAPGAE